jgi:hypothetical protein
MADIMGAVVIDDRAWRDDWVVLGMGGGLVALLVVLEVEEWWRGGGKKREGDGDVKKTDKDVV